MGALFTRGISRGQNAEFFARGDFFVSGLVAATFFAGALKDAQCMGIQMKPLLG
jgi:hypothetical protein